MSTEREYLKKGSLLRLEDGSLYEITGEPLGSGGISVIYPAERLREVDGELLRDGIPCALKECYPFSRVYGYVRNAAGEIVPEPNDEAARHFLEEARRQLLEEKDVTQKIYRKSSRLIPIRAVSGKVTLTRPGEAPQTIRTAVVIMDSLQEKGRTLKTLLQEYGHFTATQAFRVIHQLLLALREVHEAGWLHLDIQDGNILIRGALEDESDLAELIDFGAARPLTSDGRTEPVTDRVVFTTQGFTAPEILKYNDGTLMLEPAADLYSVGCLLLMLMTGRRCDPEVLLSAAEKGQNMLPRFQVRQTACPPHLVDEMQRILSKALAVVPEERYRSAEEMLKDVIAFEHAAAPRSTELSQTKYKAFLCYRHGGIDSAVAGKLQGILEHFRAPKGVSGKKYPFERVFMDRGELSAGADFGAQVDAALRNSEWLIVVCSKATPGSVWVSREIKTFLKYHDRSHILTVLTEGSPEESYPAELKAGPNTELKTETGNSVSERRGSGLGRIVGRRRGAALQAGDSEGGAAGRQDHTAAGGPNVTDGMPDGSRQHFQEERRSLSADTEILAADARAETNRERIKKLKGDELLRLAAPMLGTTYETLRQRRRAYRMQRVAAMAAVITVLALLFAGYSIHQNLRILDAYNRNMLSQSEILSNQAEQQLQSGDVFGAVELALDALPSDEVTRPVWPAAEKILADSMNLYTTEEDADSYGITGVFRHDSAVEGYFVDSVNRVLITYTATSFFFWDMDTCVQYGSAASKSYFDSWNVNDSWIDRESGTLCYLRYSRIYCIDYVNSEYRWIYQPETGIAFDAFYDIEGSLVCFGEDRIVILDRETGEMTDEMIYPVENGIDYITVQTGACNDKVGKAAALITFRFEDRENPEKEWWEETYLLLYDREADELRFLLWEGGLIDSFLITDRGNLIAAQNGIGDTSHRAGEKNQFFAEKIRESTVTCLSWKEQSLLWQETLRLRPEESLELQNAGMDKILMTAGNACTLLEEDGTVWKSWELSARIVHADSALELNDRLMVFTEDGYLSVLGDEDLWSSLRVSTDGLEMMRGGGGYLFLGCRDRDTGEVTRILRSETSPYDTNITEFASESLDDWISYNWRTEQGWLYGYDYSYNSETELRSGVVKYLRIEGDTEIRTIEIAELSRISEDYGIHEYKGELSVLLGGARGGRYDVTAIAAVNLENGEYEVWDLPFPEKMLQGDSDYSVESIICRNGKYLCGAYRISSYNEEADGLVHLFAADLESGSTEEISMIDEETWGNAGIAGISLDEKGNGTLVSRGLKEETAENGESDFYYASDFYHFSIRKNEREDSLSPDLTITEEISVSAGSPDGSLVAWSSYGGVVGVTSRQGTEIMRADFDSKERSVTEMYFGPDGGSLFVLYGIYSGEGELVVYSLEDGTVLCSEYMDDKKPVWKVIDEDTLMLSSGYTSSRRTWEIVRSEGSWMIRSEASAVAYDENADCFCVIKTDSEERIRHYSLFPRYSTDELVGMAREFLGEEAETLS